MHVLFLSDNFVPETNAPATRLHEHARRWVEAGHRVTVVTCAPNFPAGRVFDGYQNRWYAREQIDGIDVVRVKSYIAPNTGRIRRTLDYLSFLISGLVGALFQKRVDVVVATSPQFFCACAGWAAAALKRKPFVFELRDLWPASISAVGAARKGSLALRALERVELFLYARATAIVAVTHSFRRDLAARGVDPAKVHVVTNGVDLARYAPRPKDAQLERALGLEGRFVVGYLGTHGLSHALENVLEAAERLRGREEVRFLFMGDGAAKAGLQEEARRRGLTNVLFHPPVEKDAMPRAWSLCDLALVHLKNTPVFETVIPSKIFEAMGMGRAVLLAAPEGEASAIVRGADAGLCVPAEDAEQLAAAVERMLDEPALRQRAADASAAAAPGYGRDALARDMLAVLLDSVGEPVPADAQQPSTATPGVGLGRAA